MKTLLRILRHDNGATAIEYGLIAGLIAIVIVAGATLTGDTLETTYDGVATSLDNDGS